MLVTCLEGGSGAEAGGSMRGRASDWRRQLSPPWLVDTWDEKAKKYPKQLR